MIPLLGFSPDVEPTTPGAVTDCGNLIPYESGMRAAPTPANVGVAALPAACRGSAVTRSLVGTSRLFAGTAGSLYEASGATWASVGSGYTLGTDDVWRFAAFGNDSLAVCPSVGLQRSTGGAFSTVSGAPKAKAIVAARGFVMLLGTDDASYGSSPDRWWCSAAENATDWTPNVATQCTTGRLVEGSGAITAALRQGDTVVAYKERCIFVGQYVGGAAAWQWTPPIGDVGCVGVEAVADTPVGHVFVGSDNFYLFDGTRAVSIGDAVKQWWLDNSSAQFRYRTKLLWDRENNCVMVFYPSKSSAGQCDQVLVYHVGAKRWGRMTVSVEAVINYTSQGITYDGGSPLITTYDASPTGISYDSPYWLASKSSPGYYGTDHTIRTFTGIPGQSYFVTGDFGDESAYSYCRALRVRFEKVPQLGWCMGMTKDTSGGSIKTGSNAYFDGSKFPMRQQNRFHSFRVQMTGEALVTAVQPDLVQTAQR